MLFKSIGNIQDKKDIKFVKELMQIYIRIVQVYCESNNIDFTSGDNVDYYEEMKKIGIISNLNDEITLKKSFNKLYNDFITSVKIVLNNKESIMPYLYKLYNSERKKLQEESEKINNLTLVDFFCGAGGLSLGFLQEGFNVKLANDIEEVCIETYMYNHPELASDKIVKGDIKEIIDNLHKYIDTNIDVVVGGPPCQGFSEANRQRIIDDPRNKLYKYFIQAVEKLVPKFVVMENVKGMLKVADQVVEDYERLCIEKDGKKYSYQVSYRILKAKEFSVAQNRERLIFVAIRNDIVDNNHITPNKLFDEIENNCKNNRIYNLKDALEYIKPLEAPRVKNTTEIDSEITGKKIDSNLYQDSNEYINLINNNRIIPFTFNHKARYVNDVNYEIYKRLNQGDDATNEKITDIMPYAHRNHCFKDKYYKLVEDKPCRTITAHLRMDCHSHIHPNQIRALTPREAARVQSFPDDYMFLGAYLKTYMQIGNAVPPLLSRGIAKVIKKYI